MQKETFGTVVAVSKQWWLKINTKPIRFGPTDGAIFPHVVKVKYTADGKDYVKRKWFNAGATTPNIGSTVTVSYREDKPSKATLIF